jgi:hypothetical protein
MSEEANTQGGVVGNPDALPAANLTADSAQGSSQRGAAANFTGVSLPGGFTIPQVNQAAPPPGMVQGAVDTAATVVSGENANVGLGNAQNIVDDPSSFLTPDMTLSGNTPTVNTTGTEIDGSDPKYNIDAGGLNVDAVTTGPASTVDTSLADNPGAATYEAQTTQGSIDSALGEAAQGEVSDEAIIEAEQLDMEGAATGYNADGTVNYTGQALTQFASQNISTMIDTSTVAGKLLAQQLGEGNYTDTKATVMGQLDIISSEFEGPNGEAKIPSWAQGTARNVARIAAFKGMTGTAATAAMSTAIMEATLPIAQEEARFFQTVTLENLDNRQESTINRANVLAKMDMLNLDARMTTAITNSKNFMDMDLANLSNRQQTSVINTQARVQSLLEDAKMVNTQRMFNAESANDMEKFYDQLGVNIAQFNASQQNEMDMFNTGEINNTNRFNAQLESSREQFYKEMQYNIDVSNSKWRQEVSLAETKMQFEAAALDVQNLFKISSEAQNQLWDRADAILDYTWKSGETAAERENRLALARIDAEAARYAAKQQKKGSIFGAIGSVAGAAIGVIAF